MTTYGGVTGVIDDICIDLKIIYINDIGKVYISDIGKNPMITYTVSSSMML